ncbi:MAG: hypothetical protein AAF671_05815 [Pseudomonadota bacterium]
MNVKSAVIALGLTGAVAGAAFAQLDKAGMEVAQGGAPTFAEIDRNRDGNITTTEAAGTWLASSFAAVDTNENGLVDEQEYNEALS